MLHSKIKTPAVVQPSAGEIGDFESVAASKNVNSTFACFDANPRGKRTPAAVRGKLGVRVWTGDLAAVPRVIHSTTSRPGVARAFGMHRNILVDINPRFRKTKTQRSSLPPGAGQDCSRWVFGSFAAPSDEASTLSHISAIACLSVTVPPIKTSATQGKNARTLFRPSVSQFPHAICGSANPRLPESAKQPIILAAGPKSYTVDQWLCVEVHP
jgi:hypothetical protein